MDWQSGEYMDEVQMQNVLSKMDNGIIRGIISNLLFLLLIGGIDFMILLTTDASSVPVAIWLIQLFVIGFFTLAFFQGVGERNQIKKRKFRWREGIVDRVSYTQNTGHKNTKRGLIVDGDYCDPPESIGHFKEGASVIVIDLENGHILLAFSKGANI